MTRQLNYKCNPLPVCSFSMSLCLSFPDLRKKPTQLSLRLGEGWGGKGPSGLWLLAWTVSWPEGVSSGLSEKLAAIGVLEGDRKSVV